MNKEKEASLEDLLQLFEEKVSKCDILSAKLQAQISSAIVKSRVTRGMSQKEFADFMGVTQGMISKWESSDYNFTINKLAEIADKLDFDINLKIENSDNHNSYKIANSHVFVYLPASFQKTESKIHTSYKVGVA